MYIDYSGSFTDYYQAVAVQLTLLLFWMDQALLAIQVLGPNCSSWKTLSSLSRSEATMAELV